MTVTGFWQWLTADTGGLDQLGWHSPKLARPCLLARPTQSPAAQFIGLSSRLPGAVVLCKPQKIF